MITGFFLFIPSMILALFSLIFSVFDLPGISKISEAVVYFAGYLNYIGVMFPPLYEILNALGMVLSAWLLLYGVKIVFFLFSLLPWIGKKVTLPKH